MCRSSAALLRLRGRAFGAAGSIAALRGCGRSERVCRDALVGARLRVGEQPRTLPATRCQPTRVLEGSCSAWDRQGGPRRCARQKPSLQEMIKMGISEIKSQGRQLPDLCCGLSLWGIKHLTWESTSQSTESNYTETFCVSLANHHIWYLAIKDHISSLQCRTDWNTWTAGSSHGQHKAPAHLSTFPGMPVQGLLLWHQHNCMGLEPWGHRWQRPAVLRGKVSASGCHLAAALGMC